jgi:hypothetical protein
LERPEQKNNTSQRCVIRIAETPEIFGGEALLIAFRPPGMRSALNDAVVKVFAGISFSPALPLRRRTIQRASIFCGLRIASKCKEKNYGGNNYQCFR